MITETERLILRPFRVEDAVDVFEYLKAPMVNCFACMKVHSIEEAQKAVMERAEDVEYTFAIVLKDTGKVIGEIEAHPESSQPDMAENYLKDTFSPCWMLNPAYHGKGYAYETAKAFFDYLFCQKGARRIYAYPEDYNLPSARNWVCARKACLWNSCPSSMMLTATLFMRTHISMPF